MEKYLILFLLLVLLCASTLLFPVWGHQAERTFLVCPASTPASVLPQNSSIWQTREYTLFLLEDDDLSLACRLPRSRTVREYFLENTHTVVAGNAMMQVCVCATHVRCGVPYLID